MDGLENLDLRIVHLVRTICKNMISTPRQQWGCFGMEEGRSANMASVKCAKNAVPTIAKHGLYPNIEIPAQRSSRADERPEGQV